ncbi:MAG: hypothetical protein GX335_00695 [Firmicutes bacterium]|nr:hypothetical protein [Bacillota bacterium]
MRLWGRLTLAVSIVLILGAVFTPARAEEVVNMEFKEAPLTDVFRLLGQIGGYNVLVDPSVTGQVSFVLNNLTVKEALDLVTKTTGYRYEVVGTTLVVGSSERLKTAFGSEDFVFVPIRHVEVEEAQRLVSLTVPAVKSYVDGERGLLVLFGFSADLELAQAVVKQYDQETSAQVVSDQPAETGRELSTRSAAVLYGRGPAILEMAQRLLPQRELAWDQAAQSIIGVTTSQEWLQVLELVQAEDLPNFVLKGLLKTGIENLALIEYEGSTELLELGDSFHGWELTAVLERSVEFKQNDRVFTVRMGR